ncbi:3-phosphoshikimate 1-carboxyvinyltransferase [Candidatus Peregrinibacteria bacterium CG10_big_fil_rev_8_21_14_0_10_54_7]|nr:MAG: 3-phosphoshikimate 1-carboxyvinyltransferase [Candidatus Peregrinibacteria bacterium CG10_big_fil_rev_8_21_14_0_10_54_7]
MTASASVYGIKPLRLPFDASLTMPGSKSHANRAIIATCLSKGTTIIQNATPCDDVALLLKNLQKMGFSVRYTNRAAGILAVRGGILKGNDVSKTMKLNCGNAGTTLRFLTALSCIVPGNFLITGNNAMLQRPIGDLTRSLRGLGAVIEDANGFPPIRVRGGVLKGGETRLDAKKSSQYLSALLLIAPALPKGLRVQLSGKPASPSYVDLTRKVMSDFGVRVRLGNAMVSVSASAAYRSPKRDTIEGDWSAAGSFLVLSDLVKSRVRFANLSPDSSQGDSVLPTVLLRMHRKGRLTIDCTDFPDQVMNLAVHAAFRDGVTVLTGAGNLRYKECDRLSVLTSELSKAGIRIHEHADGVTIRGPSRVKPAILDPHDDHRMAFCFAVLGSLCPGIRIKNPKCISKSYPYFFRDLEKLHHSPRCIAIVGMRGSGKSTLARSLAEKLSLRHGDTDSVFERKFGPIRAFVGNSGWNSFRKEEERIVSGSLEPGYVVSLGGGAIESQICRDRLKESAFVIYLNVNAPTLIRRLRKESRPPLTGLPLHAEVREVLKRRRPLYRIVANLTVNEDQSIADVISALSQPCSS